MAKSPALISVTVLCHLLFMTSSLELTPEATSTNCVAAPCTYRGECRDKFGNCGASIVYCNQHSLWVPSCGGGGNLDKPVVEEQPQPAANVIPPTSSPITNWEKWLLEKNNEPDPAPGNNNNNQQQQQQPQKEGQKGVAGLTTGKEGNGDYTPTNDTSWINPDTWGSRPEEEEEKGVVGKAIDTIKFWDKNSAMKETSNQGRFMVALLTVTMAYYTVLL